MLSNRLQRMPVFYVVLLAVSAMLLTACGADPSAGEEAGGETAPGGGDPIKIGLLAPFSGPFANAGTQLRDGIQLALDAANASGGVDGRTLELVTADSKGEADEARTQALGLIQQKEIDALIGAYLTEESLEVLEVAADAKLPIIIPMGGANEINERVAGDLERYETVFLLGYNTTQWAQLMGDFLVSRGVSNYAYIGTNISWNHEFAAEMADHLKPQGIEPLFNEFYSPAQPAFEPLVQKVQDEEPDIVVLGDPGPNAVQLAKHLRQSGLLTPLFSVGGAMGDDGAAASIEPLGELFFQGAAWEQPGSEAERFFNEFRGQFGYSPMGYGEIITHDAAMIFVEAFRQAESATPQAVAAAIGNGRFEGVAGIYSFDPGHQAIWQSGSELGGVVVQWTDAGSRVVWPD